MKYQISSPLSFRRCYGFICFVLLFTSLSGLQAQSPCLVYNSRSVSTYKGYFSSSYTSTGLVVVGPQTVEEVDAIDGESPTKVNVSKVTIQPYWLFISGSQKFYGKSEPTTGVVGLIDRAGRTSTKPSRLLVVSPDNGYALSTASDISEFGGPSIIGAAALRAPYKGGAPIFMATALSSSYRFYDLNADRQFAGDTGLPITPNKYLGQEDQEIRAVLVSNKTTYAFNQTLTELVKTSTTLEQACLAIDDWLEANLYQAQ